MSNQIETTATVDPDGILRLPLTGLENATVRVVLQVQQREPASIDPLEDDTIPGWESLTQDEYARRVLSLAGSIDDPDFVRPPQGAYETRESIG